jgi:hypothetical protein
MNQPKTWGPDPLGPLCGPKYYSRATSTWCDYQTDARGLGTRAIDASHTSREVLRESPTKILLVFMVSDMAYHGTV